MVDYSKWQHLDTSDEEDDAPAAAPPRFTFSAVDEAAGRSNYAAPDPAAGEVKFSAPFDSMEQFLEHVELFSKDACEYVDAQPDAVSAADVLNHLEHRGMVSASPMSTYSAISKASFMQCVLDGIADGGGICRHPDGRYSSTSAAPAPAAGETTAPPSLCGRPGDGCLMQASYTTLRFAVGTRVECNCGVWEPGTIVKVLYRQSSFPPGTVAPYQIRLDNGKLIYAPIDEDRVIRIAHTSKERQAKEVERQRTFAQYLARWPASEQMAYDCVRSQDRTISPAEVLEYFRHHGHHGFHKAGTGDGSDHLRFVQRYLDALVGDGKIYRSPDGRYAASANAAKPLSFDPATWEKRVAASSSKEEESEVESEGEEDEEWNYTTEEGEEDEEEEDGEDEDDEEEDEELPQDVFLAAVARKWPAVIAWLDSGGQLDAQFGGPTVPEPRQEPRSMADMVQQCCYNPNCPGCVGIPTTGMSLLHLVCFGPSGGAQFIPGTSMLRFALPTGDMKVTKKDLEMLHLLLDRGASIDIQNVRGQTPLMLACMRRDTRIMEALLERGADAEIVAADERTAL